EGFRRRKAPGGETVGVQQTLDAFENGRVVIDDRDGLGHSRHGPRFALPGLLHPVARTFVAIPNHSAGKPGPTIVLEANVGSISRPRRHRIRASAITWRAFGLRSTSAAARHRAAPDDETARRRHER